MRPCPARAAAPIVGLAAALVAAPAAAETFVGSNVDTRYTLAYKVDAAAAQAWLPEGWTLASFGSGPIAGSNLLVILIDRHISLDPEDKPAEHPLYRGVALVSLGGRDEENRVFVTRVYITDAEVNPYKNSVAAAISRAASSEGAGNDPPSRVEAWSVETEDGGTLEVSLSFQAGIPSFAESEALPYSNVEPDFHRIYRYEQVVDLVSSTPAGVDRIEDFALTTTIEELAPMFDGSEELVAVIAVPWYLRHTYLP